MALAVWAAVTGCNGCFGCKSPVETDGGTLSKSCDEKLPVVAATKLDVLFVVDNSNSMSEEQRGVALEMTDFVASLRVAGGVAQDIRVGVITTSVYQHQIVGGVDTTYRCNPPASSFYCTQSGKLQPVPDQLPDGGVIPGTGSERLLDSADPQFVPKFQRLVQQGISGSGQETPFEALRLAVSPPLTDTPVANGGNGGFLRDGARLLIVVLSDEDDCSENNILPPRVAVGTDPETDYCGDQANSLTPVSEYYDIFSNLKDSKGNLKEIVYTAIAPVGIATKAAMTIRTPAVSADGGPVLRPDGGVVTQVRNIDCPTSVQAGHRHRQMAELFFADLSNLDSICKANYKETLINIANLAGVSQTLEITGVPDPHVLQLIITRTDGRPQLCTLDNGDFTWEAIGGENSGTGRVHFESTCKRRRDDRDLQVDRICIF